jgi:linoleoyl-CoA desaturase
VAELLKLIVFKLVYVFMHIVLPIFILGMVWWQVLVGFILMQMIAGFLLSVIFQLAHVVEDTTYVLPDEEGNIENSWAVHQLYTTANFAKRRKFLSWFIGGLNYQIEHHLFPYISHVHYPKIAEIVKKTAQEFQLPYFEYQTFREAVASHWRQLRALGRKPALT